MLMVIGLRMMMKICMILLNCKGIVCLLFMKYCSDRLMISGMVRMVIIEFIVVRVMFSVMLLCVRWLQRLVVVLLGEVVSNIMLIVRVVFRVKFWMIRKQVRGSRMIWYIRLISIGFGQCIMWRKLVGVRDSLRLSMMMFRVMGRNRVRMGLVVIIVIVLM